MTGSSKIVQYTYILTQVQGSNHKKIDIFLLTLLTRVLRKNKKRQMNQNFGIQRSYFFEVGSQTLRNDYKNLRLQPS